MLLETISTEFRKVRSVNSDSTGFPSKVPTVTEPKDDAGTAAGAAVIDFAGGGEASGACVQNKLLLVPYGLGSDNDVFSMRVIGWKRIKGVPGTTRDLWIPVILAEMACTVSTAVGVAGAVVLNTERFCDTLSLVTGNEDVSIDFTSPTGDVIAHVLVTIRGFSKIEFTFDQTTGTPTMNCLMATL